MNSTKVTKDKPASCYNRPESDKDKPGRVTDKPGSVTDRPFSYAGVPLEADSMTLYFYKVGCKSRGVGDKNKQQKNVKFLDRLQLTDRT